MELAIHSQFAGILVGVLAVIYMQEVLQCCSRDPPLGLLSPNGPPTTISTVILEFRWVEPVRYIIELECRQVS